MMISRMMLAVCIALLCLDASADEPISIGTQRELFVDRHLIDSLEGAQLVMHTPQDQGQVLAFDRPWEGLFSAYVTIIRDGDELRAYYRGHADDSGDGSPSEMTCLAVSKDGKNWSRPNLGLFKVNGTTDNNIVLANASPVTHNFTPFLDKNPNCKPSEKYKAIGGHTDKTGIVACVSPDGLKWSKLRDESVFGDNGWVFDSQNLAFWSEAEQCYCLYYRRASGSKRAVARATSNDFINWSKPEQMIFSNTGTGTPRNELYTNQTQPYFRAPHLYIATAARFMKGRRVVSDAEAARLNVHPQYYNDTCDAILMTSRGGHHYDCTFGEGFLRPGIGLQNWVSRTNYPALNIVQTGPTEMSLYVNQDYGQPTAHLRRYSLRLDGFSSVQSRLGEGTLITKPILFQGRKLSVNFATSAAGYVRVELLDANAKPIPGYSEQDSIELIGNEIDRTVRWNKEVSDASPLAGKPVRLKISLSDADVFAFQFTD